MGLMPTWILDEQDAAPFFPFDLQGHRFSPSCACRIVSACLVSLVAQAFVLIWNLRTPIAQISFLSAPDQVH
jgi:hypothetical protein